ncbi:response regulator transcription factor [Lysinibacillus sp. BW-2-10]|uniref:response regulator transcription factor n=1 Tax=Lysinibacillus sp. BW-2-10 TaxID=2590030 RepID=UPI00117D5032|nr:response regulator transcription factor [Lysinibacillus sp. BW-2-10]TSI05121.1 response regulator transcription factor [Lysinibacillus sp. BW-2-10]
MISVLIIDDHPIVLDGSKLLFQGVEDIHIETESDPTNVLSQMQNTRFDVFLVDVNMNAKNGIVLAAEIKAFQEDAFVILYTGDDIRSYYPLILEKKIDGVLSKTVSRDKVIQTIRSIVQGDLVLPVDFINFINKKMQNNCEALKLTKKETQLMTMLMDGYTNKMIAEKLNVTQRTVERYLTQLFTLLDVTSRVQAIEVVKEKNLI